MYQILDKAHTRWINVRARNVMKSHRESRTRKQTAEPENNEGDEVEEIQPLHADTEHSADNNAVYIADIGFVVMPTPDQDSFKNLTGHRFRNGGKVVRIAYNFDNGWQTGKWESVSDRATRAETELSAASFSVHIVNFNRVRHPLQLSLASYGMDGKWCLVLEEEPPCDSDGS